MVKDILGLSANDYSVVHSHQVLKCWISGWEPQLIPWVMKVLCAAALTAESLSWLGDLRPMGRVAEGGTAELDGSGSVSVHPATR